MAGTVTVACKIPMGIVLREFRMTKEREQTPNGVRDIDIARPTGKAAAINGVAAPPNKMRFDRQGQPVHMYRGYALTPNVDADLWANWLHHHADHPMVKNMMIFAAPKQSDIEAMARENEKRRSNLEPMYVSNDPKDPGDPRAPNRRSTLSNGRSISTVMTADREAA